MSIKLDYSFSGFILYNCSKVVRVSTKLYPIKLLCPTKLTTTPNNSSHCRMKDYYHENDDFYEVKFRSEFFAPLFRGMAIAEFTYTKKTLRERTLLLTFKLPLAFENTTLLFFREKTRSLIQSSQEIGIGNERGCLVAVMSSGEFRCRKW